ncbi:hypothetical protein ACTXT7_009603 [Hymenolepis weldensis]
MSRKTSSTFPLTGKRVFLHLLHSDQLTKILSRLGADVRPFFDRSVEVVIYNPEARQSPTSIQNVQQTPAPSLSRGRAMVMAANQGATPKQQDVLSQARTLEIRLVTTEGKGWIRELPENVLRAISGKEEEPTPEYFDPDTDRRFDVRSLRGSAVKVTDRRNSFRPLFAENTNFVKGLWPSIRTLIPSNPSSSADPHAHPPHPAAGSEPIRRPLTLTTATTPQPSGQEIQTAAPVTNVITTLTPTQPPITVPTAEITPTTSRQVESPAAAGHTESERRSLKSKRREEPSGYCELCATHFQKLYEHLHSIEHTDFANNPENFRGIDNALSAFQGFEQDLKQYIRLMVHQPSSSVTQTPSVTPGRSDTGPVAPVSRTPGSPPQHTVMSRQHDQSPLVPESFPLPPPLTPIHRPPPEYAENIPVLFSDDEPSMPELYPLPLSHQSLAQAAAQSQEFHDSAGFEPSIPLVPQEEPNRVPSPCDQNIISKFDDRIFHKPSNGEELSKSSFVAFMVAVESSNFDLNRFEAIALHNLNETPGELRSPAEIRTLTNLFSHAQAMDYICLRCHLLLCAQNPVFDFSWERRKVLQKAHRNTGAGSFAPVGVAYYTEYVSAEPTTPFGVIDLTEEEDEFGIPLQSDSTFQYDEPQGEAQEEFAYIPIVPLEHVSEGAQLELTYVSQDQILVNPLYDVAVMITETEDGWYLRVPYNQPEESSDEEFNIQPESRYFEPYGGPRIVTQGDRAFDFSSQMRSTQQQSGIKSLEPVENEPVQNKDPSRDARTEGHGALSTEVRPPRKLVDSLHPGFTVPEPEPIEPEPIEPEPIEPEPIEPEPIEPEAIQAEDPGSGANIQQVQATPDQQEQQEASTTGNILELPGARDEEEGGEQHQSSNDFSSSNSVQIGGRFRLCRKCRIAHIPTAIAPDLLQKYPEKGLISNNLKINIHPNSISPINNVAKQTNDGLHQLLDARLRVGVQRRIAPESRSPRLFSSMIPPIRQIRLVLEIANVIAPLKGTFPVIVVANPKFASILVPCAKAM